MKLYLASPRGFCAGVQRAISIVEKALEKFGAPVYVRHEIVHNQAVVSRLREKGAVFVKELDEVPSGAVAIFSAHGVPTAVYKDAEERALMTVDATCPLVKKVHSSVQRHSKNNRRILLIGHRGHPEVVGTMGQLDAGRITLVETPEDALRLPDFEGEELAYTTQTTLSIGETRGIIEALKTRFPHIKGPASGDLCYATTNRQSAVTQMAEKVDLLLVIGPGTAPTATGCASWDSNWGRPPTSSTGRRTCGASGSRGWRTWEFPPERPRPSTSCRRWSGRSRRNFPARRPRIT